MALAIAIILINVLAFHILWRKLGENENLKYEFITIIAHKFRTPLTQTKWLIESFLSDERDARKIETFKQIGQANQKLIDLTGTLIELTDSDDPARAGYVFERLSACALAREIGASFKDAFHEKNIFFAVQCPEADIMVKIDRARMSFVLSTLLENACAYTPPGRRVDVLVSSRSSVWRSKAVISIIDHGMGMTQADVSKLFTKFFRSDSAKAVDTEGFGIGLYLAQTITRRHKGKIEAFSDGKDMGSTFNIVLPRV
jgi:signal transduction histidine kinase